MMYPAYTHYTDPTAKEMKTDLSSPYQPWHYYGPVPHQYQYHGCCNHTCYGGSPFGFWPPYTHYPPPVHPHGLYAPYPGPYPAAATYSVPPQHYSVEQPRYEYDKNSHAPRHCCNHREDDKVPHVDHKDRSESLVPLLLKDLPEFPVMLVPRGYMSESKAKEKEKHSRDLEPVKRGANGEMAQDEQGVGGDNRFPFKILWLPPKNDEVGNDTKKSNADEANKGLNEGFGSEGERDANSKHAVQKAVPMKQASANKEETGGKNVVQKAVPVKQASANKEETAGMNVVQKAVPVKQASANKEETGGKHVVQKVIPVKQLSTDEEKDRKSAEAVVDSDTVGKTDNGSKGSLKTPKLPPVCLRIDPLPRKKKSSRSPSPGEKGRSNESPVNSPKSSLVSKDKQGEGEIKTDDHANKVERDNVACHGDVPKGKVDENEKKKNLTEHEAALIIQSVYRGFEVRKSQPLKKLRQIYEVKKQVFELRNDIQDIESYSSTANIDGKKKLVIGETIMSLLLKLDTIQGLHPYVREVRKSVAKELVGLQEKLDSLASAKSEGDAIQEKSDQAQACRGLCENYEHTAESDAVKCENEDVQDTESQRGCNTIGDLQLGLQKEKLDQAPTERDEAPGLCESQVVEAKESQEDANTGELRSGLHKEKLDQAPTERDEAMGLCENREVECIESEEGCNAIGEPQLESDKEKFDQSQTESDEALELCENHKVATTESEEGCNTVNEPQLESHKQELSHAPTETHKEELDQAPTEAHKEELDQAPTEALGLCENHEAEAIESQEGCNTIEQPQLESHKEELDQEPTEARGSHENHEVESTESQEVCNAIAELQTESHKVELDQAPTKYDGTDAACVTQNDGVEAHDMKLQHNSQEPNNNQLHMPVETDHSMQRSSIETMVYDSGACQQRHDAETAESFNKTRDNNLIVSGNVQMDDGNMMDMKTELAEEDAAKEIQDVKAKDVEGSSGGLVEENEKLRVAVEELMKAGNAQLGVIRELTGRVKDLEKKLSKKKKVKVNNKCSSRRQRGCVVQKT